MNILFINKHENRIEKSFHSVIPHSQIDKVLTQSVRLHPMSLLICDFHRHISVASRYLLDGNDYFTERIFIREIKQALKAAGLLDCGCLW